MSEDFYSYSAVSIQGNSIDMSIYKGKYVLVVNTASQCGLTQQYEGLEKLYLKYKDKDFVILGFPCNQFGGQEPGDEKSIQDSLKGALTDEGYRVQTASSGKEGLEALAAKSFDTVLLDIWMPEMDGLEVLKQIKAQHPQQTIIMMSGHGTIETAVKATKLGAYDFIEKPLSLERLLVL